VPIYEYSCLKCGERIEALQGLHDAPLTICEACGGELKKLLSAPAFQFKGSGWYVTDYSKKDKKASESSESEGGGDSKSGSDSSASKSESKGETKTGSATKSEPSSSSKGPEKKSSA
jgi:putative FmdB family regulatory protein